MTRQAYVDRERKLMIFWSPKCGCTSIVDWWFSGPVGIPRTAVPPGQARRWLRQHDYKVGHPDFGRLDLGQFFKVAVSRHPFDRAVSAFVDKFVGRRGAGINSYDKLPPYSADLWRSVRGVPAAKAPAAYDGLSFVEFLTFVVDRVEGRDGEPVLNAHWNTQAPFAGHGAAYDEAYDVSALGTVFANLNQRYGFGSVPARHRSTVYDTEGPPCDGVSSLTLAAEPGIPTRERFRSGETEALVRRAYAIDFLTFGYDDRPAAEVDGSSSREPAVASGA